MRTENSAVQADVEDSDNENASDDGSLPSINELLFSAEHDNGSTYTNLSPEHTPMRLRGRTQGDENTDATEASSGGSQAGPVGDPGTDSRMLDSVSSLEVADSDDGGDDIEIEGRRRSSPPNYLLYSRPPEPKRRPLRPTISQAT
jgi:hypothetical protein